MWSASCHEGGTPSQTSGLPVFLVVLLWRGRGDLPAVLRLGLLRWQTWLAASCYAWTMLSFVLASKLTTDVNAILLQYTAPIYVFLIF